MWIIATIIILMCIITLLIFLLFIAVDVRLAKIYKNAWKTTGKVKKQLEDFYITAYGFNYSTSSKRKYYTRKYYQYEVDYEVDGNTYVGVTKVKTEGLVPGDTIEVRYILNEKDYELVTCVYTDRLRELAIGSILGIILSAAIIIYINS